MQKSSQLLRRNMSLISEKTSELIAFSGKKIPTQVTKSRIFQSNTLVQVWCFQLRLWWNKSGPLIVEKYEFDYTDVSKLIVPLSISVYKGSVARSNIKFYWVEYSNTSLNNPIEPWKPEIKATVVEKYEIEHPCINSFRDLSVFTIPTKL